MVPQQAPLTPWCEVHVDYIGLWTSTLNKVDLKFDAITCINPATDLLEIICLTKTEKCVKNTHELFEIIGYLIILILPALFVIILEKCL